MLMLMHGHEWLEDYSIKWRSVKQDRALYCGKMAKAYKNCSLKF